MRSVFRRTLRPPFIILDQFEEIFVLGSADERQRFFTDVEALITSDVSCRVILSLREDYVAQLSNYEEIVPTLFETRLRIEAMGRLALIEVIEGTTGHFGVTLENGDATARQIIARLGDGQGTYQLVYLQVYLDQLYRRAAVRGGPIVITDALIEETGTLETVLAGFVDEQIAAAQKAVDAAVPMVPKTAVNTILGVFVTAEGTKQPRRRAEVGELLPDLPAAAIDTALAYLRDGRILRQVEDRYELAHDTIAARVDSLRTADERHLNEVRRIVDAAMAKRDAVKIAWLADEDLATVKPVLPLLRLDADQAAFVEASRRYRTARSRRRVGCWVMVSAVLLFLLVAAVALMLGISGTIAQANNGINEMTKMVYIQMRSMPGSEDATNRLFELSKRLNEKILIPSPFDNIAKTRVEFWHNIYEGDLAYNKKDFVKAAGSYKDATTKAGEVYEQDDDLVWLSNQFFALERWLRAEPQTHRSPLSKADLDKLGSAAEELEGMALDEIELRNGNLDEPEELKDARADLAKAQLRRARVYKLQGAPAKALASLNSAVARYGELITEQRGQADLKYNQSVALSDIADLELSLSSGQDVITRRRSLERGLQAAAQGLAILEGPLTAQPTQLSWRMQRVHLYVSKARLLEALDPSQDGAAAKLCEAARRDVARLQSLDPQTNHSALRAAVDHCNSEPASGAY